MALIYSKHLHVDEDNWYAAMDNVTYNPNYEHPSTGPIEIIIVGPKHYLVDGHHRFVTAIRSHENLTAEVVANVATWAMLPPVLAGYIMREYTFVLCPDPGDKLITIKLQEKINANTISYPSFPM